MRFLLAAWLVVLVACGGRAEADRAGRERGSMEKGNVVVRLMDAQGRLGDPVEVERVVRTDAEWKRLLTPEQYEISRGKGTERAFCGVFHGHKEQGVYSCAGCGLPLFRSSDKFESGTGWPSFTRPVAKENVHEETDRSHGMVRTEIQCVRCGAHLGHVFEDGPPPTGLRYCLNSAAMTFEADSTAAAPREKAYFAAGCFWGVQALFDQTPGVVATRAGYQGGHVARPTYEQVCSGRTGHAEVVEVVFDPARLGYRQLLRIFWENHDPTTSNRQGPDVGEQYRSAVFAADARQKAEAEEVRDAIARERLWGDARIVTEIADGGEFWPAEPYHQKYYVHHGIACHPRRPPGK